MKRALKILSVSLLLFAVFFFTTSVKAGLLNDIVHEGGGWFKNGYSPNGDNFSKNLVKEMNSSFIPAIRAIGYTIFFVTGAILGIKYMWSGAEGRGFVKNGLITYMIGVVFFFLADQLYNAFSGSLINSLAKQTTYSSLSNRIIGTVNYVVRVLAIVSVMVIGLRYMFADASKKASLKSGTISMLIGAILILCLSNVLTLIVNIADKQIDNNTKLNNTINYTGTVIERMIELPETDKIA